ncbi:MAG TPA: IS110 family transposase [Vicinamibacterales bacterium]|nr:IS110 family transposase [Vicinamibacterales bacterium]
MTATLFVALELGSRRWKLAFAIARGDRPRTRTIVASDLPTLWQEIATAKPRVGLDPDAPVRSCYEAGRDGFWLHRALVAQGIVNVVVDPASIAVDRRRRRAKTDRLDAPALVTQLMNATAGDRRGGREVRVPSLDAEADRQLQREWDAVLEDRKRLRNRMQGLLVTQGVGRSLALGFPARLERARLWDGKGLAPALVSRLTRDWMQLRQVEARLNVLRRARRARIQASDRIGEQTRHLLKLRAIGSTGALTLTTELFTWRAFRNGRQLGAIVGLVPTPFRSDQTIRERGISGTGNRRLRALMVELASGWLRWQPTSALTRWFTARVGDHPRARRIGIVAVARKLLIALWRYVEHGIVPEGAVLRA